MHEVHFPKLASAPLAGCVETMREKQQLSSLAFFNTKLISLPLKAYSLCLQWVGLYVHKVH